MLVGMHLDVESVRTFLAVLDHGGMTAAAERLHLTQSAVSWKIRRLEERIERQLFIRDGRDLRPTRVALDLVPDARQLVQTHDRAVRRLQTEKLVGTVRVGSNEEVSVRRLLALIGEFSQSHPGASVEFVTASTEELVPLVERGEIDVALVQVVEDDLRPDDTVLWSERLVWATARHWRFTEGEVPLITFGEHCFYRTFSEPMLDRAGIEFNVAVSVPSEPGVHAAVEAGLGVAVLGESHLGGDVIEWPRAGDLDPLPTVHQIARTAPGDPAAIATALVAVFDGELGPSTILRPAV